MAIPQHPDYNENGFDVYLYKGANVGIRPEPGGIDVFVIHTTEPPGDVFDSREYLLHNPPGVSVCYLAGEYKDTNGPRLYKYCSETKEYGYTQGFSLLGKWLDYSHDPVVWQQQTIRVAHRQRPNQRCLAWEIEGSSTHPPSPGLIDFTARHVAGRLVYWQSQGRSIVILRHSDIDSAKSDPSIDWLDFMRRVYHYA